MELDTSVSTGVVELEIDFSGCPAVGVGGYHSQSYGDEGEYRCDWCGQRPERLVPCEESS